MKYVENFAVLSPCKGGGFIYATAPAAFRFLQGPQLPVVLLGLVVLLFNLVLTTISLRFFGRRYATSGGFWKIRANLSFDWRKCQCLLAISAINVICDCQGYTISGSPFSRSQTLFLRYGEYFPHFCQHSSFLVAASDKKIWIFHYPLFECVCRWAYSPKS